MADLEKFKNLDINEVISGLAQKKDLLAQIVVAVASLLALLFLVKGYFDQKEALQKETEQVKTKIEVIHSHDKSMKNMKSFLAAMPKPLMEEQFSAQIAQYAAQTGVSILSLSPGQKVTEDFDTFSSVSLGIAAASYKDFLSFLRTVESSSFALRVDSCVLSSKQNGPDQASRSIVAQMEISSVDIKK